METNKIVTIALIFTVIIMCFGNMLASYYFLNKAVSLITAEAPPLTISKTQSDALKSLMNR